MDKDTKDMVDQDSFLVAEEYLQRNLDLMLPGEDKDRNEEYLTAEWMK